MARSTSETGSGISSSFIFIDVTPPWPVLVRGIIPYVVKRPAKSAPRAAVLASFGAETFGPGMQIALLLDPDGAPGCGEILATGGNSVAGHLEQVRTDSGQPVIPRDSLIRRDSLQQFQARLRAVRHA